MYIFSIGTSAVPAVTHVLTSYEARPGMAAKMSCSGKELMLTLFYDSNCQQPSERKYFPVEMNGKCVPSGDGSMSVMWDC
jgi:hypothetical protein